MKEVYIVRHAQPDESGMLTPESIASARQIGALLAPFATVIARGEPATMQTAHYMAGPDVPDVVVDDRAGIGPALANYAQQVRDFEITRKKEGIVEYMQYEFAGGALYDKLRRHAAGLELLAHQTLGRLQHGQRGLIVSYGLLIMGAMWPAYKNRRRIMHCSGFRLSRQYDTDHSLTRFAPHDVRA